MKAKIAVAADHAGFYMKEFIFSTLEKEGYEVRNFGTFSDNSVDYPDFAHTLAQAVSAGEYDYGFLFCGSGNGVNMTANKHKNVRSALCWESEIARLARAHNNANVCAIPARFISANETASIVTAFLNTSFEGGRHEQRVQKIC
ncbi:MAG: ribose 5-phosphate isomerase B [Bacteroidales bacterium]|jgi:ribose 5-phosphate isomerase B|nr:ribose 5-phosphate isomerase B [Bacteroidales bacterium]